MFLNLILVRKKKWKILNLFFPNPGNECKKYHLQKIQHFSKNPWFSTMIFSLDVSSRKKNLKIKNDSHDIENPSFEIWKSEILEKKTWFSIDKVEIIWKIMIFRMSKLKIFPCGAFFRPSARPVARIFFGNRGAALRAAPAFTSFFHEKDAHGPYASNAPI